MSLSDRCDLHFEEFPFFMWDFHRGLDGVDVEPEVLDSGRIIGIGVHLSLFKHVHNAVSSSIVMIRSFGIFFPDMKYFACSADSGRKMMILSSR